MKAMRAACVLALALGACSTLGTPASPPGPLPHGGTGQFRALTATETMLGASPPGLALMAGGRALDGAMPIEGNLFYAGAMRRVPDAGIDDAGIDDAGLDDAGLDDAGIDAAVSSDASLSRDADVDAGPTPIPGVNWNNYPGREIYRSTLSEGWGFATGTVVFSASEAWEGGYVTDPWVVRRADGRYLLYYAAAGGIGVATADALGGPWTRASTTPILPTTADGTPRRPSAIATAGLEGAPAAMIVYYELAGTMRIATSDDGITVHDVGAIPTMPVEARDDRDGVELAVGSPGAISVPTPAGRHVVRFYYESRRTNGTVLIGMLGSGDGIHFDQALLPVFAERDRQRPAPRYVDARTTLLYTFVVVGTSTTGAEIASISPAGVRLVGVPPTTF